jgi:hypothetical protein
MFRRIAFTLVVVFACTCALQAQNPAPPAQTAPGLSGEVKQMYNGIKNNLTKMAEKMPEENYAFKATPDIRTFGQLIGHVADSQARTCSMVMGEQKAVNAGSKTSKADLVAALKESFTICDAAFNALTDAAASETITTPRGPRTKIGMLAGLISHSNEEYGYMAVYMRLKGVVPPSSEPR